MDIRWREALSSVKPDAAKLLGAAAGAVCTWFAGLSPIARALLIVQGADVLTGVLLAVQGKSTKSESGRISSGALTTGLIKKGLEWLVVFICLAVGEGLNVQGISGAAMTYMIATEMVSLMENLSVYGLNIPMLQRLLDVAQEKAEGGEESRG